jgi:hypothetical protein
MVRTKKAYKITVKTNVPRVIENLIYYHTEETLKAIGMDIHTYFDFPYLIRKAFIAKYIDIEPKRNAQFVAQLLLREKSSDLLRYAFHYNWIPTTMFGDGLATLTFPEFQKVLCRLIFYRDISYKFLTLCPKEYLPGILGAIEEKVDPSSDLGKTFIGIIENRLKK